MCGTGKAIGSMLLGLPGLLAGSAIDDKTKREENEVKREAKAVQASNANLVAEMNKPKPVILDPLVDEETKNKKLRALRFGLSSTVKTSPMGVPANGALKTKLGQ